MCIQRGGAFCFHRAHHACFSRILSGPVLEQALSTLRPLVNFAGEGTESDLRRAHAAAADTAASPKPRMGRKSGLGASAGAKRRRGGEGSSSSDSSDGEREVSGESGDERESRGAAAGAAAAGGKEGQQQGAANGEDPLESWFRHHYSLLKAGGLMGVGYAPASAETGRPAAAPRRRPGGVSPGKPDGAAARRASGGGRAAADRERDKEERQRREARRAERQAAKAAEVRPLRAVRRLLPFSVLRLGAAALGMVCPLSPCSGAALSLLRGCVGPGQPLSANLAFNRRSHSSLQGAGSEDEGPAVASPRDGGSGRRGSKGGRELKRLQMWAWERRGRSSGSSSEDEDEDEESGSGEQSAPGGLWRHRQRVGRAADVKLAPVRNSSVTLLLAPGR